jgi:hypothetical protein
MSGFVVSEYSYDRCHTSLSICLQIAKCFFLTYIDNVNAGLLKNLPGLKLISATN